MPLKTGIQVSSLEFCSPCYSLCFTLNMFICHYWIFLFCFLSHNYHCTIDFQCLVTSTCLMDLAACPLSSKSYREEVLTGSVNHHPVDMVFSLVEFSSQSWLIVHPTSLWTDALRAGPHFGPISCGQGRWGHMVWSAHTHSKEFLPGGMRSWQNLWGSSEGNTLACSILGGWCKY